MKLIAFDSSGLTASVAILTEDVLLAEYTVSYKKKHSQTLLPMFDEIVRMTDCSLDEIDAIAIAEGPGSFTGLRIGAATVKGLGLALNKPILGIPTLDALAYQYYATDIVICPLMDARRNQVYTGLYTFVPPAETGSSSEFSVLSPQKAEAIDVVIEEVNRLGRRVVFLGDGVSVYREEIEKMTRVPYDFSPVHAARQRAGAVGVLAIEYWKKGLAVPASKFAPVYLRASQAERERVVNQGTELTC